MRDFGGLRAWSSTFTLTKTSSSLHVVGDERPWVVRGVLLIQDRMCDRVCKCEGRPPAELGPPRPSSRAAVGGYNRVPSFSLALVLAGHSPFLLREISRLRPTTRSKREAETGSGPPRKECVGRT